jgi:intracellular sulfur oxidation DsrE/DsrF family protein
MVGESEREEVTDRPATRPVNVRNSRLTEDSNMKRFFATGLLLTSLVAVAGAQQQSGPIVMRGGKHYPVPNPTVVTPTDQTYKIAWDMKVASAKPDSMNAALDVPARFLNQSAALGIPRANVQAAIVVHGTAGEELLSNAEYRARKGVDNPNIALLEELSKAGVQIILCGQTMGSRKIARDQLLPFVKISPSAVWAHAVLQRQGFTINPF